MKTLLLAAALAWGATDNALAQEWRSPLPVDSTSGKITYTGVVLVPGATKAELYSRAREWFASTFGSAKTVLEMDDREAGKLIGKAYAEFGFAAPMVRPQPWTMWRKIKVEVKEGRYRYTLDSFAIGGPINSLEEGKPMEAWLAPTVARGKTPSKMVLSAIQGVSETATTEAASLQKAMAQKAGGDF